MKGNDPNSPEALFEVPCRVCLRADVVKKASRIGMNGHLRMHKADGWNKARYLREFVGSEDDFFDCSKSKEALQADSNRLLEMHHERKLEKSVKTPDVPPVPTEVDDLTTEERSFYETFSEQLKQQTDRDEILLPVISSLCLDMIVVQRLRSRVLHLTSKKKPSVEDMMTSESIEKTLKTTEDRISKTMDSLGVSRAAQLKRGSAIKSTSAQLISGYLDEIERMSPEMLDALRLEELRVLNRSVPRIERFLLSEAPVAEQDTDDVAAGKPLSLQDALSRAGIAAGGSSPSLPPAGSTGSGESDPECAAEAESSGGIFPSF